MLEHQSIKRSILSEWSVTNWLRARETSVDSQTCLLLFFMGGNIKRKGWRMDLFFPHFLHWCSFIFPAWLDDLQRKQKPNELSGEKEKRGAPGPENNGESPHNRQEQQHSSHHYHHHQPISSRYSSYPSPFESFWVRSRIAEKRPGGKGATQVKQNKRV